MGSRRRRKPRLPEAPVEARIESLGDDGRGLCRVEGKTVFVDGALPGETVLFRYTATRARFDEGTVVEVTRPSPDRVEPRCPHFGVCGGCRLQHLSPAAQVELKQQSLLDALRRIGEVQPAELFPPLLNPSPWGYRRKARLGVKYVAKKRRVLVGFRERGSSFVADLEVCRVLHPRVGELLPALGELIGGLSIRSRLPQVEVAMDDERLVLVFRILEPAVEADLRRLRAFGERHGLHVYLQPQGPETVAPLSEPVDLFYELPELGLRLDFLPGDFTQVNTGINRQMVSRALELLAPGGEEGVLDLFCGIGNFTLALARRAGQVTGVEGDAGLVQRARANARRNRLDNVELHVADLYGPLDNQPWLRQHFDKVLLDPPRSGAREVLEHLPRMGAARVVYVSCHPGTLARDAGELVHRHGYRLSGAGVMDMFPHTAHVESIAVFDRP